MPDPARRSWTWACLTILLLCVPALGVRAWMASTFPSYLADHLGQDLVFAFAWCGLLVCAVRWRLLGVASVPVALVAYLAWLFLVLGEGVSYYLQADTFNARFFAHLNPADLRAGLGAFPAMIGGGIGLFVLMLVAAIALLVWAWRRGRRDGATVRNGFAIATVVILALTALGVGSAPRRFVGYLVQVRQSAHFADTPQGQKVAALLDLHPVPKSRLVAAPGKNLVWIYLESLERIFWSPKVFPGLTPNLDRLRSEGLDFSGFETFSGANYTMAGMFASQCGAPLFTSAFAELDGVAGNTTDAETFHPKVVCLGDVLHAAGYRQIYLGGAPIGFSNKGLFYRLHGYNRALGLRQLEAAADNKLPQAGWGLYDSALLPVALQKYKQLEASGQPFNLTLLTLDTHPPDGRPSPGCPKYAPNPNSMLQAVHCTDHLIGKFVDELSRQPDWKNTVVVIMSDHLMMRNDAEALFPSGYHRRPALIVLNAGRGVRAERIYHMDIAPTLLDLMGVRTNATFIAGADRSAPDARGSLLVDNPVTDAVLRKALWSRDNEFRLCKRETLVSSTPDGGMEVGGREFGLNYLGEAAVGIWGGQSLDFFVDNANAKLAIADAEAQKQLVAERGDASILSVRPLAAGGFTVDWLGTDGATAHLGEVPTLRGLAIRSPRCGDLIARVDHASSGASIDLAGKFQIHTDPPPEVRAGQAISFTERGAVAYETGMGWLPTTEWGTLAIGDRSELAFRLDPTLCRTSATLRLKVDPYLPPSRPGLVTDVLVNGKRVTAWRFDADGQYSTDATGETDDPKIVDVTAAIDPHPDNCTANVQLRFARPGAPPPPYPAAEDPRPLQMRLLEMDVVPAAP